MEAFEASSGLVNLEVLNDEQFKGRLNAARSLVNNLGRGDFDEDQAMCMDNKSLAESLQHAQLLNLSIPDTLYLREHFVKSKQGLTLSLYEDDYLLSKLTNGNIHEKMVDLASQEIPGAENERRLFVMLLTVGSKPQDIDPLRVLSGAI